MKPDWFVRVWFIPVVGVESPGRLTRPHRGPPSLGQQSHSIYPDNRHEDLAYRTTASISIGVHVKRPRLTYSKYLLLVNGSVKALT